MKRSVLMLLALWVLGPGSMAAQESVRERARATLPAQLFEEILDLATRAERDGVPSDPLFNKALEGMAKHVPPDRILPGVNGYSERLRQAHGAFEPGASGPLIVAGADALQRGVDSRSLRQLGRREEGGPHPSPVAVLVLADLVEAGVPADRALGVLQEAMRMRTREQQMLGISGRVRQLMRQGQSPQEAADQVRRSMQRGRGGGGVGPPVPPGSEPMTRDRRQAGRRKGGG